MVNAAAGPPPDAASGAAPRAAVPDHVVQLHDHEDFLLDGVSGFLAAGVRAGQPVLAIAVAARREALAARVTAAGVDVARAARAGGLVFLDAEELLAAILHGGVPHGERFRSTVGAAVERLSVGAPGKRIRGYGEMADVLWRRGDASAAIRIEEMWNDLARTHPVTLLCAYAVQGLADHGQGRRLEEVCAAHAHVAPAESRVRAGDGEARLPEVVRLRQRAYALEHELERRREMEAALRQALAERDRLDAQMAGRNEELSRAVRRSEAFVGMLGHDLRNPLNAISTAAALVTRRSGSEEISKPAMRIVRSSRRMARMIDQILDFTRIRLGRGLPVEARPLDLADLCRAAAEELEGETAAPRVRLDVRGDVAGSWDPDRLAQLVSNLVGNALLHGRAGAPVSIVVDGTGAGEVVLAVENAGSIPPELLPAIFEPFASTRGPRRGAARGLGLGLHIARQIAAAHGGSIAVASSEEGWTRFTVRLPRAAPAG